MFQDDVARFCKISESLPRLTHAKHNMLWTLKNDPTYTYHASKIHLFRRLPLNMTCSTYCKSKWFSLRRQNQTLQVFTLLFPSKSQFPGLAMNAQLILHSQVVQPQLSFHQTSLGSQWFLALFLLQHLARLALPSGASADRGSIRSYQGVVPSRTDCGESLNQKITL